MITSSNTKLREDCLSSQLFFKDSPGFMDDVDSVAGANIGLYLRSKYGFRRSALCGSLLTGQINYQWGSNWSKATSPQR